MAEVTAGSRLICAKIRRDTDSNGSRLNCAKIRRDADSNGSRLNCAKIRRDANSNREQGTISESRLQFASIFAILV